MAGRITCKKRFVIVKDWKKKTRACACGCEQLDAIDPTKVLSNACIGACNNDYKAVGDAKEWLCRTYDSHLLWSKYQVEMCGFEIEDTTEYQQHVEEIVLQEKKGESQSVILKVMGFVFLVVIVLVFVK